MEKETSHKLNYQANIAFLNINIRKLFQADF